jgi:D-tyrosyl-tRNA(Tyr) deacylase
VVVVKPRSDQSESVNETMVEAAAHAMITCGEAMDDEHMRAAFWMGDRYVARKMLEAAVAAKVASDEQGKT